MKIYTLTKYILGWGSVITAVFMSLYHFGVLGVDPATITSSITLFVLGAVIISEVTLGGKVMKFNIISVISTIIAITALMFGVLVLFSISLPSTILGVMGYLYMLLAVIVGMEMYR